MNTTGLNKKALALCQKALGEVHPDTADNYNNLATNLIAQGQYAAAGLLAEKALASYRQALGEAHPDTASSYNNLAFTLKARGRYAEAGPL